MAIQLPHKLFSHDEYTRMIETGILTEDEPVELIRGEIVGMSPISLRHSVCVARLELLFHERLGRSAIVWVQNPIRLPNNSQPQPDVALLKWRDDLYAGHYPGPEDVLLLVEVADSSLVSDRKIKIPLYAEAGIGQVWLVNLNKNLIEVLNNPANSTYRDVQQARKGDTLTLLPDLNVTFTVDDLLP